MLSVLVFSTISVLYAPNACIQPFANTPGLGVNTYFFLYNVLVVI